MMPNDRHADNLHNIYDFSRGHLNITSINVFFAVAVYTLLGPVSLRSINRCGVYSRSCWGSDKCPLFKMPNLLSTNDLVEGFCQARILGVSSRIHLCITRYIASADALIIIDVELCVLYFQRPTGVWIHNKKRRIPRPKPSRYSSGHGSRPYPKQLAPKIPCF